MDSVLRKEQKTETKHTRIALIPAYEPSRILTELAQKCSTAGLEVIIVDDGSGISCGHIFAEASAFADILTHPINRGKGAAIRTGLQEILKRGYTNPLIVTLDADGQHTVSDALRLLEEAEAHPGALILGRRQFSGETVPLRSRLGNSITRMVYRLFSGVNVHDTQTGLRAFGSGLLPEMLRIQGDRYEYEMNVLLEFAAAGIPMREIPIHTIYENNNESSHFNALTDSCRIYREILKFSASSFLAFLLDYALYGVLLLITAGFPALVSVRLSNIAARVISAGFNFTVNRRVVFRSSGNAMEQGMKYAALAAGILAVNTGILSFLTGTAGIQPMAAKIITEAILFVISWVLQKKVVFSRKDRNRERRGSAYVQKAL
ncbi:MAG: bifunctional glycosyltransferase family 2/GtrA family protein [Lachnospiraceae bacterium]|nr:bifunctional glycosyltransferase family 2/GtrA family protein [Lachnospiraceae bacterium]